MSVESVMPFNHFILCCPLLLLPSIFLSSRVFSNESALRIRWPEYWRFSFSISPSKEYSGLISFRIDWYDLFAVQGTLCHTTVCHTTVLLSKLYRKSFVRSNYFLNDIKLLFVICTVLICTLIVQRQILAPQNKLRQWQQTASSNCIIHCYTLTVRKQNPPILLYALD